MKVYLLVLLFILTSYISGQEKKQIVAEVGPIKITAEEFKKRYEFVPHIGRHIKGREERLKAETIYSIIAEKLWALEAEELGYDSSAVMKYTFQSVEDMHVRDALYRKEIKSKLSDDPDKYTEAKKRALVYLNAKFIFAKNQLEIERVFNKLQNGESFDSLLSLRGEAAVQKEVPYQIHFGQMSEFAEDSVYSLKVGEFSSPLKSPDGWYIFKLLSVEPEIIENDKHVKNMEKRVRQIVNSREEENVYQNYYKSFFPGHQVDADGEIFWSFSDKIIAAMVERRIKAKVEDGKSVHLEAEDFYNIKNQFGSDSLNMIFIQFEKDPVSLGKFIYSFAFEGFFSNSENPDIIRAQLNGRIRRYIELELLTREANKRGMKDNLEVNDDIKIWKDYYLGTLYKQTLFDSSNVSEEEVYNYYIEKKESENLATQVKIIEIRTKNLDELELIFNEVDQGIEFKEIQRKFKTDQSESVESEYFPVTSRGEIGRIAGTLEVGEIYGPIEIENDYIVFKLIDKKVSKETIPDSFDNIKDEFKKQLKAERISEKMIGNTVKLANKYGVKVNEKLLYNMDVINYNMVVYRYMGFGGRLLAVPLTPTFIQWVEEWQRSQSELP